MNFIEYHFKKLYDTILVDASEIQLAKDTLLSLSMRVLAAGSIFLLNVVIARKLGANEAGNYFLAFSIVTIISSFTKMGFDNVFLKQIRIHYENTSWSSLRGVFIVGIIVSSIISIIASGIIYYCAEYLAISVFQKVKVIPTLKNFSFAIVVFSLLSITSHALQGIKKTIPSLLTLNIIAPIFCIILIYFFEPDNGKLMSFFYTLSLGIAFIYGLTYWVNVTSFGATKFEFRNTISMAIPLMIVSVMTTIVHMSIQFISGIYLESGEVAIIATSQRLIMLINFILIALNFVIAPKFASLFEQGKLKELETIVRKITLILIVLCLPIFLSFIFFAENLMGIFGEDFASGGNVLRILSIGQFFNVATGSVGILLMMSGHEKVMKNIMVFVGFISIAIGISLTSKFGLIGAAISNTIAVILINLFAFVAVQKRLKFRTIF